MDSYIRQLDIILGEINEPTLTNSEVATIQPSDPDDLQEMYDILDKVLKKRGGGQPISKLKSNAEVNNITINRPKKDYSNMTMCFGVNNIKGLARNDDEEKE